MIFKEYFPDLQRRSALITIFSFFEHQLDDLCKRYAEERKFILETSDLKGDGISRLSIYLKKMADLPIDRTTTTWKEITKIQGVRNALVHNDGKLKIKNKELIKHAQNHSLVSEGESVKISAEYLHHVIETVYLYFKEIDELIPE